MKNKILGAAALASTFALPAFASDLIGFDADGSGGLESEQQILTLDWAPGSALANDAVGDIGPEGEFVTYAHGELGIIADDNGSLGVPNGMGSSYEITFISGFFETATFLSQTDASDTGDDFEGDGTTGTVGETYNILTFQQTVSLSEGSDQSVNFFEIYYDDLSDAGTTDANALSGLGYGDGLLILSGDVSAVSGEFSTTFTFVDVDGDGEYDIGETLITVDLDNAGGDSWADQQTVVGTGATDIEVDVGYYHEDFFLDNISSLVADLFFNTSNILPFQQVNPSNSFDDGAGGTFNTGDDSLSLGDINGFTGPDFLFQADANNSFVKTRTVPEPGAMMLFGLGLFALGFSRRKKLS